ncbi:MAG TPA: SCP2 sterol-binding domain-containing protein [Acidimicrobiia bacterium]|nr:SCP2 sterol-binding domain-containing protein [Acidimicrobiia bacterium]
MAKFLSSEWAAEVDQTLNNHQGFKSAIGNADLGIAFNVSGGPDGDVAYYLKTSKGDVDLALGNLEGADVTINTTYDTASSISKGDLNVQTAFMTGKLKVAGNLAKLMMHQAAIAQWSAAVKDLPTDY